MALLAGGYVEGEDEVGHGSRDGDRGRQQQHYPLATERQGTEAAAELESGDLLVNIQPLNPQRQRSFTRSYDSKEQLAMNQQLDNLSMTSVELVNKSVSMVRVVLSLDRI